MFVALGKLLGYNVTWTEKCQECGRPKDKIILVAAVYVRQDKSLSNGKKLDRIRKELVEYCPKCEVKPEGPKGGCVIEEPF
jgi:hypothetical protein